MLTAVAGSSGGVAVTLPTTVGTNPSQPPAMACYITDVPAVGNWLAIGPSAGNFWPYCGAVFSTTLGAWRATMNQMPAGWTAAFVIVY